MKSTLIVFLALFIPTGLLAQRTDTLRFYSKAFAQERTVLITTPFSFKYQSDDVKLPVIYILDGQHEWFVNPLLNTINYLQYTHQMPQAIIVTIPLLNRYKECGIKSLSDAELPLHKFITVEVEDQIKKYHPNNYKVLVGHSFSASFSLYSYLKNPAYYAAVIANTPLDSFRDLIIAIEKDKSIDKSKLAISVGGLAKHEDYYHRKTFEELNVEFPQFFKAVNKFVADNSGHTAVPIVANPYLLTRLFSGFNQRYSKIASVNDEYKLINMPTSVENELSKIEMASKIDTNFYPPELADLNGLASRYLNSNLNDYGIGIYQMAVRYFPNYYDFHLQLYQLLSDTDIARSKSHLNRAFDLLNTVESDMPVAQKRAELDKITKQKQKNGW